MKNKVENIVLKVPHKKIIFFIIKSQALILLFRLPIYIYTGSIHRGGGECRAGYG